MASNTLNSSRKPDWSPPSVSRTEAVIIAGVYLGFLAFLLVQHAMVFLYNDDWGLAVLDYRSVQNGFSGQDFHFSQVIAFLADMYNDWSGRVVPIFLEIYLLKFGLWYVRIVQVLAILGVLACSLKIASDPDGLGKRPLLVWVLPVVLFLALPSNILIGGVYWFAASTGYVWGSAVLLLGAYAVARGEKLTVPSCLLLSVAAIFNEQMGCAVIAFFVSYVAYDYFFGQQKQRMAAKIYFLAPIVLLAGLTISAPGNFHRKSLSHYVSDSLLEVVLSNLTHLSRMIFAQGAIFFWILIISFVLLSFASAKRPILSARSLFNLVFPVIAVLVSYLFLPQSAFAVCFIGFYSYVLFKACRIHDEGMIVFSVFSASLASLAPLLFAPETPGRATIPFYLLCFVPIIFSFAAIKAGKPRWLLTATVGILFVLSALNTASVFKIYRGNYETSTLNHYQLMVASYMLKNNMDIGGKVILFKPSPDYAAVMAFRNPSIERWMRKYYEIPKNVILDWRAKSTYTASDTTNNEWVNGVARGWATGFFVFTTPEAERDFAVGKKIVLADGSVRTVVRNQVNGQSMIVYLDGPPLDGKLVGYPKSIVPYGQPK